MSLGLVLNTPSGLVASVAMVHLDKGRREETQTDGMFCGSEWQSGVSSCLKITLGSQVPSRFLALTRETGSEEWH